MSFSPYDVVGVPFPFTDKRASRRCPALVVSPENFHEQHGPSVLAMVTATGAHVVQRCLDPGLA